MSKSQDIIKIAVVQNRPLHAIEESIQNVLSMVRSAADEGADLIVLPEIFSTAYEFALMDSAAAYSDDIISELRTISLEKSLFICAGSLPVRNGQRLFNRSQLIDNTGRILYTYDKTHLFDVSLPEITVSESKVFTPGSELKTEPGPIGRIGTLICYDIRFPEAARSLALRGIQILCVPAAFSETTGKAHWHTVMRARAIENQIFLCAASPAHNPASSYPAYGHSMIVSPWGDILAEAGTGEEIITAPVDPAELQAVRRRMPLQQHRRPELYRS